MRTLEELIYKDQKETFEETYRYANNSPMFEFEGLVYSTVSYKLYHIIHGGFIPKEYQEVIQKSCILFSAK